MNVALIGYGYWGMNVARVFQESQFFHLHSICDHNKKALSAAKQRYRDVHCIQDINELSEVIDLVAIITPVESHYSLGKLMLERNKHILLTKPFTKTYSQAEKLFSLASKKNKVVFIDHTFLFHPAVHTLKSLLNKVGKIYLFFTQRMNLGLYQPDVNVLYDLLPHDLSILIYLLPENIKIRDIQVKKAKLANLPQDDFANIHIKFANNIECNMSVSWLSPFKIRQFLVIGSEGMILYDDVEVANKIKFFDTKVSLKNVTYKNIKDVSYAAQVNYRLGDMYAPAVASGEALTIELQELQRAIEDKAVREYYNALNLKIMKTLDSIVNRNE